MSVKAKIAGSTLRDRGIVSALEALVRIRGDLLQAVQLLLTDLASVTDEALHEPTLCRLALRMFCVQRYQQLRRSSEHSHLSARELASLIRREAARIDPTWMCSWRSLQSWIRAWNGLAEDGVAAGWRGLIRPTWVEQQPRSAGRRGTRSPAAIAFFHRMYVDKRSQTVAACHRATLQEAQRRGWSWPASCKTTRAWLAGCGRGTKRKRQARPKTPRTAFDQPFAGRLNQR